MPDFNHEQGEKLLRILGRISGTLEDIDSKMPEEERELAAEVAELSETNRNSELLLIAAWHEADLDLPFADWKANLQKVVDKAKRKQA